MVPRKLLSSLFLQFSKHSSAHPAPPRPPPDLRRLLPGTAASSFAYRRMLLQRRSISQSGAAPLLMDRNAIERIRSSIMQNRAPIGAFVLPPLAKKKDGESPKFVISVEDSRRLFMASRIEAARARLRGIPSNCVSYSEFVEVCREVATGSDECAREIAAALDNSGAVIVLADVVFLRPDYVVRAIERAITLQPTLNGVEEKRSELKEMEAKKSAIDKKAGQQAKRELWAGMGLILIQTAGFFRLTFWELSWDVMEPICFFTTSIYCMMGYIFFLRTAHEPSFEALFASRFAARQRRLMRSHGFDLIKFNELRRALGVGLHTRNGSFGRLASCDCHCHRATQFC